MAALTEEQALLREQAKTWAADAAPVAAFRALRDSGQGAGFDPQTWKAIGELGWGGIVIPEAYGGVEMGHLTFGVLLEELGRTLTASPLLASALGAANALVLAGDEAQKSAHLPRIADGSLIATVAVDEGPRHDPRGIATRAQADGDGFVLSGEKARGARRRRR